MALGTSLPEIVGASFAARGEKEADGCLSHILGRIAVTVLVGVGMPWLVAAIYHAFNVRTYSYTYLYRRDNTNTMFHLSYMIIGV